MNWVGMAKCGMKPRGGLNCPALEPRSELGRNRAESRVDVIWREAEECGDVRCNGAEG